MLDIMYKAPEEKEKIKEIVITPEVIESGQEPLKKYKSVNSGIKYSGKGA